MAGYNPYSTNEVMSGLQQKMGKTLKKMKQLSGIVGGLKKEGVEWMALMAIRGLAKELKINQEQLIKDIKMVVNNPLDIKNIKDPIFEVQMIAVMENPDSIQYIENPTDRVQFQAVNLKKDTRRFIKNPADVVKKLDDISISFHEVG